MGIKPIGCRDYECSLCTLDNDCKREIGCSFLEKETNHMRKVDIIASGYEWICPDCETLNREIEINETVKCVCCDAEFETNPPEDAFGD